MSKNPPRRVFCLTHCSFLDIIYNMSQLYMKLNDKVNRPSLKIDNINRDNKMFKKLVERYKKWCNDNNINEPPEIYEQDIIKCLFRYDLDGYSLSNFLKDESYIEPDSELVDILDHSFYVKNSLTKEILDQWVKENFLEIPNDSIGKKVNAKQGFNKYQNHYITSIKAETYEVTINEDPHKYGGWVVGYENVTFVD